MLAAALVSALVTAAVGAVLTSAKTAAAPGGGSSGGVSAAVPAALIAVALITAASAWTLSRQRRGRRVWPLATGIAAGVLLGLLLLVGASEPAEAVREARVARCCCGAPAALGALPCVRGVSKYDYRATGRLGLVGCYQSPSPIVIAQRETGRPATIQR